MCHLFAVQMFFQCNLQKILGWTDECCILYSYVTVDECQILLRFEFLYFFQEFKIHFFLFDAESLDHDISFPRAQTLNENLV